MLVQKASCCTRWSIRTAGLAAHCCSFSACLADATAPGCLSTHRAAARGRTARPWAAASPRPPAGSATAGRGPEQLAFW